MKWYIRSWVTRPIPFSLSSHLSDTPTTQWNILCFFVSRYFHYWYGWLGLMENIRRNPLTNDIMGGGQLGHSRDAMLPFIVEVCHDKFLSYMKKSLMFHLEKYPLLYIYYQRVIAYSYVYTFTWSSTWTENTLQILYHYQVFLSSCKDKNNDGVYYP